MFALAMLLLPVARTSPVLRLISLRPETAVQMHTLLGRCFVIFVLAHSVTMIVMWIMGSLGAVLENNMLGMVSALIALAAVVMMAALSWFRAVRHVAFELFYYVHHLFVLVIVFSSLHSMMMLNKDGFSWNQDLTVYYLILPVGLYIIDRAFRVVALFRRVDLASIQVHGGGLVKLRLSCPDHKKFSAGSFAFICCPVISQVEWHPFSASAIDRAAGVVEFDVLKVGGSNSWSSRLLKLARAASDSFSANSAVGVSDTGSDLELLFEQSLAFKVDGPYGDDVDLSDYTSVVFVAGGIGLTSLMPIYKEYARSDKTIRFIYLFRRNSFDAHQSFFESVERQDDFVFVQTREDEAENVVADRWPHNAVVRGARPRVSQLVKAVAGNVCVVCCGPQCLAEDANLVAHKNGWDFVNLSFFF